MIREMLAHRCSKCGSRIPRKQGTLTWTGSYLCILCAERLRKRKLQASN